MKCCSLISSVILPAWLRTQLSACMYWMSSCQVKWQPIRDLNSGVYYRTKEIRCFTLFDYLAQLFPHVTFLALKLWPLQEGLCWWSYMVGQEIMLIPAVPVPTAERCIRHQWSSPWASYSIHIHIVLMQWTPKTIWNQEKKS